MDSDASNLMDSETSSAACASNLMDSETSLANEQEDSSVELEVHKAVELVEAHKGRICKGHHARFL